MAQVLKHDILTENRKLAYNVAALFGVMLIPLVFILMFSNCDDFSCVASKYEFILEAIFAWGSYFVATEIMKPMQTKEGRINFLMLPATNAEKFAARFIYVTIGYLVTFFVALVALDLVYQLLVLVFKNDSDFFGSITSVLLTLHGGGDLNINGTTVSLFGNWTFAFFLPLFGHSLWILGGSLWYKRSFIKTWVAQVIFGFVVSMAISAVVLHLPEDWYRIFDDINTDALIYAVNIVAFCLTIGVYYFSYKLFVRSQVIPQSKFFLQ